MEVHLNQNLPIFIFRQQTPTNNKKIYLEVQKTFEVRVYIK